MSDEPKLKVVPDEQLDEEEKQFHLRRDVPGVKGASAIGIVSINVAKTPGKNEFFRTHPTFRRWCRLSIWRSAWKGTFSQLPTRWFSRAGGYGAAKRKAKGGRS